MIVRKPLLPSSLLALLAMAGCATTQPDGTRQKVVVPTGVSQVYSEVDLQMQLATAAPPSEDMNDDPCLLFEYQRHVRKLGERLVDTAMRLYPDLVDRDIKFRFEVVPSAQVGIFSNAGGTIVVLQGSEGVLPDAAMVYLLGREMGHVIARHHDENSAATVMFSVLTQVLFPAAALVKGLAAVLPSTAAGTAATATAVSYLGATALKTSYREDHLREADQIAMVLLVESGMDLYEVAEGARKVNVSKGDETWLAELRGSLQQLDLAAYGPRRRPFRFMPYRPAAPAQASAAAISDPRYQ